MKNKKVGVYRLCCINVEVWLTSGVDGGVSYRPNGGGIPRINIGAEAEWWRIVECLLHEAAEFNLEMLGYCFMPSRTDIRESTTFVFHFDHAGFSRVSEDVGFFLAESLPGVQEAWREIKEEGKKK